VEGLEYGVQYSWVDYEGSASRTEVDEQCTSSFLGNESDVVIIILMDLVLIGS
jgi:hypothetical protein